MKNINLLVQVYGGGDLTEVPCALLMLKASGVQLLIDRIEQVKALKESDRELYCIERWDGSALWFDRSLYEGDGRGSEELDGVFEEVDASTMAEISEELATVIDADNGASIRTECDILVVTDNSCHWRCIVKHTGVRLETDCLSRTELRAMLE